MSGVSTDNSNGSGIGYTSVNLVRTTSGVTYHYTGSGWQTRNAFIGSPTAPSWSLSDLPTGTDLIAGAYSLVATTYDRDGNQSASATVNFTVVANHAPAAAAQTVQVPASTPTACTLAATDADADPIVGYAVASQPAHGTLSGTAPNLTYTPNAGYSGSDSFTFTATDWQGAGSPATVTLNVLPPPVAVADTFWGSENTALFQPAPGVLGNDNGNGLALTASQVTGPAHGTLTLNTNGSFLYTPNAGWFGTDTFTYRATDSNGIGGLNCYHHRQRPTRGDSTNPEHSQHSTLPLVLAGT